MSAKERESFGSSSALSSTYSSDAREAGSWKLSIIVYGPSCDRASYRAMFSYASEATIAWIDA